MNTQSHVHVTVDNLHDSYEKLSPEEKLEFVSRILGKQSGLSVVLGNGCVGDGCIAIQSMDLASVAKIMEAIATRISDETSKK